MLSASLKRGGAIAALGASLLILAGTFFPTAFLKVWGIPIFFTALFLIGAGLRPYRKLSRLQLTPHEMRFDEAFVLFCRQGKPLFQFSQASVEKISYFENKDLYGIGLRLKRPIQEKIRILQSPSRFAEFISESLQEFDRECDFFLPYFSKTAFQEFVSILKVPLE